MKSRLRFCLLALALTSAASLASLPAQAAPGDLDPSFSNDGKVLTDFSGHDDGSGGVAIQSDGKIVVAGFADATASAESADFALARYDADGTLDTTFGTGGKVTTDFGGSQDIGRDLAIQADGKILVVGLYQKGSDSAFALARYTPSGQLDPTFGQGGKVLTHFPGVPQNERSRFIVIQSDQKIVIGGSVVNNATGEDFALVRYKADGSIDSTFGTAGFVTTNVSFAFDSGYAAVVQSTGKIVVGGVTDVFDVPTQTGTLQFLFVRYKTDGTVDTSFGSGGTGTVITEFSEGQAVLGALALAPDGSLIGAGSIQGDGQDPNFIDRFALAKLSANGIPDSSFGTGGKVTTVFGPDTNADGSAVVLQPDGRIIVSGGERTGDADADFGLARYNADGTLDDSFGENGLVTTAISTGFDSANGLALQTDGKLIAAGNGGVTLNFAVARYETALVTTKALNLSTRADVGTGENVLIGGFIITGSAPEAVLLRAIGPSLSLGGTAVLADPVLELHKPDGTVVTNDNWKDTQQAAIIATGIPPQNDLESAILATLDPGAYTAIVRGNGNTTGVALVEAYDLDQTSSSQLANISTRGFVDTGDNVMIGGFIIGGATAGTSTSVFVRGIGPSLTTAGITNALWKTHSSNCATKTGICS
ncbi:MAG: hypothetical protein ABI233_07000 [Chthoniobacterales bacterium]